MRMMSEHSMRRFGFVLEYEGTKFHGSQVQPSARTVQGELQLALKMVFGSWARLRFASRTDAGVHAMGQVVAATLNTRLDNRSVCKALNFFLPSDVKVRALEQTSEQFDPLRDAQWRLYRYTINDAPNPGVLDRRIQIHVACKLDVTVMARLAPLFVGTRDFAAFAGPVAPKNTLTIRDIHSVSVVRNGDLVQVIVQGKSFIHQQVRRICSALMNATIGRLSETAITEMLRTGTGKALVKPLPPQGLCLMGVGYNQYPQLTAATVK